MKEIKDIVLASTPYGEMYSDNNFIGTVFIDNNKIEGIVRDDFKKAYFVFGIVSDIEIKLVLSSDKDKELVKIYEANSDGLNYYGEKSVINSSVKIGIEECKVGLFDPKYYRFIEDNEPDKLKQAINYKKKVMGEETSILYKEIIESKLKNKCK